MIGLDTSAEIDAVLADTIALAAGRGWSEVGDFVGAIAPAGNQDIVLLESAGTDSGPLADWLSSIDATISVHVWPLESIDDNPGATLLANRLVVVLTAGEILTPEAVAATLAVLNRPSNSRLLIFVGVENIHSSDDLRTVDGGIWQLFIGGSNTRFVNQDPGDHGCLLFATAPSPAVRDRAARDRKLVLSWVTRSDNDALELAGMRASHALDLAAAEAARAPRPVASAPHSAKLDAALAAVVELRQRVMGRLDADLAAIESETAGSLRMLEQNMLRDVPQYLDRRAGELSKAHDVERMVGRFVQQELHVWVAETTQEMRRRMDRAEAGTEDLLDTVDWSLINQVARHPSGTPYPDPISNLAGDAASIALDSAPVMTEAMADSTRNRWVPSIRTIAYGGALAGVSVVTLGPLILPAIAAAAVGAACGELHERHLDHIDLARRTRSYARAIISATVSRVSVSVRDSINQSFGASRRHIAGEFQILEDAMSRAKGSVTRSKTQAVDSSQEDLRVTSLRQRLAHALSPHLTPSPESNVAQRSLP